MQPATPIQPDQITCSQCGGELHPDEGQIFVTCPFCSATVYLDKSRVVFHWYLAPTLNEQQARGNLARWMAGNDTVKNLDQKSTVVGVSFEYFPLWYFKHRENGRQEIILTPAAATSVSELRSLRLPAGDLRKYDPALESTSHPPSIPLETALNWTGHQELSEPPELAGQKAMPAQTSLSGENPPAGDRPLAGPPSPGRLVEEMALVHVPLFTFKYQYQGRVYTALVEAGTGTTLASLFPAKAEAPYQLAGGLSALVFLCLASLPVIGAIAGGESGLTIGAGVCAGLGLLAVPALFALAAWVAAKV